MSLTIVVHGASAAQRCALCHDSLDADPWRCPGCLTALHGDCAGDGCPSLACGGLARPSSRSSPRPLAAPARSRLDPVLRRLVWLVAGVLSLLWPLLVGSGQWREVGWVLPWIGAGPAAGQVLAAVAEHRGIPGKHHLAAFVASLVGLGGSVFVFVGVVVVALFRALGGH